MLEASRSTISGNAPETMRPPGIKRSTLFRRRDTCSRACRLDSRITSRGNKQRKRNSSSTSDVTARDLQVTKRENRENDVKAGNITGGYRPRARTRFEKRISENEAAAKAAAAAAVAVGASAAKAKVLENSESKIHLESGQKALEEFESCWEWKVEERPRRSLGMSKLRSLQLERAKLFSGLRSGLEKMLQAVREMKSQQSKPH